MTLTIEIRIEGSIGYERAAEHYEELVNAPENWPDGCKAVCEDSREGRISDLAAVEKWKENHE